MFCALHNEPARRSSPRATARLKVTPIGGWGTVATPHAHRRSLAPVASPAAAEALLVAVRGRGRAAARRLRARRRHVVTGDRDGGVPLRAHRDPPRRRRGARRRWTPATGGRALRPGHRHVDRQRHHEGGALLPHRHQAERRSGARDRRTQLAQQLRAERRDLQPGQRSLDRHQGHARARAPRTPRRGSRTARSSSPEAATTTARWPAPSCTTRSPARGPCCRT